MNRENLLRVFRSLKANGGQAPGVDGLRYTDVSTTEIGDVLQQVSGSINASNYQPQPTRSVRLQKPCGGHRTLKQSSIVERVIATAVAEAIWLDPTRPRPGSAVHSPGAGADAGPGDSPQPIGHD